MMKENIGLNYLKAIACIVVVFLHCPLPGIVGDAVIYGLRFSVPVFFMITGFFSYGQNVKWIDRQIHKILDLLIKAELFSGCVLLLFCMKQGKWIGMYEWLNNFEFMKKPLKTIVFGSFFNGTLWYLYALLWTLVFMRFTKRVFERINTNWMIPVFIVLHIVGRMYIQEYGDINSNVYIFRSFFLFGIPFVLLGKYIAQYQLQLKKWLNKKKTYGLFGTGIMLQVCEFVFWHQYMDLQFSTVIISVALFWMASQYWIKDPFPVVRKLGREYSTLIYVLHTPIAFVFDFIMVDILNHTVLIQMKAFFVLAVAYIVAGMITDWKKIHVKKKLEISSF